MAARPGQLDTRSGVTLLEVSMALLIAMALVTAITQTLIMVGRQRQRSEQRLAALHEAENTLEQLMTLPWNELTPQLAQSWQNDHALMPALRGGQVAVQLGPEQREPRGEQVLVRRTVTVTVSWPLAVGSESETFRLVAWQHRLVEDSR